MNERILELARQVWPDPNTSHVNHEKFAELIVKECLGLTHWQDFDMCVEQRIRLSVAQDIKEHFGVEE
jgi:hypothetical protein